MRLKHTVLQRPMKISLLLWLSFLSYYYWACLCFNVPLVSGHSVPCLEDQKLLLLQLKKDLKFDSTYSNKLVFWNDSTPCGEWRGVCWDEEGHVAALDLSEESINGGLDNSSTLFSLQYLQHLNLASNNFNSEIPFGIKNLRSLTCLNLSSAGFVGQIPMGIAQLTRLAILDLSNAIYDYLTELVLKLEIPNLVKLVQNLSEVRELHLDGINISLNGNEWGPALSSSMPHLQVLSMSSCSLSGPIHSSLRILQNLSIIRLDDNPLSGPIPDFFAEFSNLTQLHLRYCDLRGRFPNEILQIQSLTSLDLQANEGLQGSLPDFPHNASLQTLILTGTNFSGALPYSIGSLQNLSKLDLSSCHFSGTLPKSMSNLTELAFLDLSDNFFTGPIPTFDAAKNLTSICLFNNKLSGGISSAHFKGLVKLDYIDLRNNSLNGSVPMSLFQLPLIQNIDLSDNRFQGQLDALSNVSSSSTLQFLDLSNNYLEGPIPQFIFQLRGLWGLWLSSNKFNGTLRLDMFARLQNLYSLDLSYNNLSIDVNVKNASHLPFPKVTYLRLASCNLKKFPDFLTSLPNITDLDLSSNEIKGEIPYWFHDFVNLNQLNLSHNLLQQRESIPYNFSSYLNLYVLDLHDNHLQGTLPAFPQFVNYLDFSYNKFSCVIPHNIGNLLSQTKFFSLSHNAFHGRIPISICNTRTLKLLDLSHNNLSGGIPHCLAKSKTLGVLNLGNNNLSGSIPDTFQASCTLQTLDLSGNNLQGRIPKSLSHCTTLEVLDIGNNKIDDGFPCLLKKIPTLKVMVLKRNNFYGPIGCPNMKKTSWEMLQIVDISLNNFNGTLPGESFPTWKAMLLHKNQTSSKEDPIEFRLHGMGYNNYQDRVTLTMKGQKMILTKILTIFTSIDFSSNQFEGSIPEEMMHFTALHGLNLSNNNLSGNIPSSIGKLNQIESLDLSKNSLTGEIPRDLASLSFLSFLNFSCNHLVGRIPTGTQLQSFEASSFQGNDGLYGPPLTQITNNGTKPLPPYGNNQANDFCFIMGLEFGVVFGLAIVIAPLFFWKQWRIRHWKCVDFVLCSIFPQIYVDYQRHEGQWVPVLRWSH